MKTFFSLVPSLRCGSLLVWLLLLRLGQASAADPGTVIAWGLNDHGQSSVPTNLNGVVAIAGGGCHSLALKRDRTVLAWGNNNSGQSNVPENLTGIVKIAAGHQHSLALKGDGTVVAWGYNLYGQSTVPTNLTGAIAIAAGLYHSLALKGDGTVVAWGDNGARQTVPSNLSGVVAIAASVYHNLALKEDGTVAAWGGNSFGESAVPTNLSGVVAIAAGGYHSLALKGDGTVVAWGDNGAGQSAVPAGLTGVIAVAAGYHHSLALEADGRVAVWGDDTFGESAVPMNLNQVVAIAAGGYDCLALSDDSAPALFRQPTSRTVTVGTTVVWDVGASGARPLHYQWRRNDVTLTGETNSVLFLPNAQLDDSGDYSVVATNGAGAVTSQVATLTVVLPTYTVTLATNGYGTVAVTPLKPRYTQGEVVQIAATPARWHVFSQWNDGVTDNPRSVTIDSNSSFTATFIPATPLETLDFGGVSRLAPVGMPAVFVGGVFTVGTNVSARGSAIVSMLTTFSNGTMLFTLDGSEPDVSARLYSGPFTIKKSATLRALA